MIDYEIFFRFYNKFKAQGFHDIDPKDTLVVEINETLDNTRQIFHAADLIKLELLYCSKSCYDFYGIKSGSMDPSVYIQNTHPDDLQRFGASRSKVFKLSTEMYESKLECMYLSSNFRTKSHSGKYINLLRQVFLCYSESPIKTIYQIEVSTDVTELYNTLHQNHYGYHYHIGSDKSFFRYPDKELLSDGIFFSKREFEIIKGISQGLESHEIAEKLFLSVHTVNTHRRNILSKTGKRSTHELVHELQERGVI